MIRFGLSFGAMCKPIAEQLGKRWSFDAKELEPAQRDADAITRLSIRGLLSEKEGERARRRLMKQIAKLIHPLLDDGDTR